MATELVLGGQHSKEPFCSIEADDGKTYEEARKPPITVHNAVSALGKDYMKKNYPGGGRHAFWGQMECGLVLSSVSPWEMVQKEKGVTRGGYVCKWCRGFWKGKMDSSRFLQITSGRTVLQLVLDEPPERLYNRWVKDRIEFYKRLESAGANCTSSRRALEGGPQPSSPTALQCLKWLGARERCHLVGGVGESRESRLGGHPPPRGSVPSRMRAFLIHLLFVSPSAPLHDDSFCGGDLGRELKATSP